MPDSPYTTLFTRTCPVCNRNFQATRKNATYCNVRCRQKQERERQKEKTSAFYMPETGGCLPWVMGNVARPTLEKVQALERLCRDAAVLLEEPKGVKIYGTFPEEWKPDGLEPEVFMKFDEEGSSGHWSFFCYVEKPKVKPTLPPVVLGKVVREVVAAQIANGDDAAVAQAFADAPELALADSMTLAEKSELLAQQAEEKRQREIREAL